MSAAVRWAGRLSALGPDDVRTLLSRGRADAGERDFQAQVASLVADVRSRGDAALRDLARHFDRVTLESLEVPREVVRRALDRQPPALRRAMERSARNVAKVHGALRPQATRVEVEPGIVVERRPDPLRRVGVYAPGGRAA
ncbi:MAG TPA: histidinol dehydrogenase, partial [Myxococcaceae bacterium]|nr:histidinol dehydrogenase [Myxococcaceae bacterium]